MLIDKLKDKERSTLNTSDNNFSINIKNNKKKTGQNNCIRNDKNETIRDLVLNDHVQNDKRESVVQNSSNSNVPSKKLKRRFKTTNHVKTNENISARDSVFRSKSTFNTVIPESLPCNIVNLNLDDLIENKNQAIDQKMNETNDNETTNQPSSRILEKPRKMLRRNVTRNRKRNRRTTIIPLNCQVMIKQKL